MTTKISMLCLNPKCTNGAKSRGLCVSCYQAAQRYIKQGRTTWESLAARGRSLPAYHKGPKNWLLEESVDENAQ